LFENQEIEHKKIWFLDYIIVKNQNFRKNQIFLSQFLGNIEIIDQ